MIVEPLSQSGYGEVAYGCFGIANGRNKIQLVYCEPTALIPWELAAVYLGGQEAEVCGLSKWS